MSRMNDNTIYRQAAIAHAISGLTRELEGEKWIRVSEVRESLQTMPSAERRGRWVDLKCDQCGQVDISKPNYCPNCGARMEEN